MLRERVSVIAGGYDLELRTSLNLLLGREEKLMNWSDTYEIAIALSEKYPNIDPLTLRFTDLREMILSLERFDDDSERCGEKILEAIQMAWLDEQ